MPTLGITVQLLLRPCNSPLLPYPVELTKGWAGGYIGCSSLFRDSHIRLKREGNVIQRPKTIPLQYMQIPRGSHHPSVPWGGWAGRSTYLSERGACHASKGHARQFARLGFADGLASFLSLVLPLSTLNVRSVAVLPCLALPPRLGPHIRPSNHGAGHTYGVSSTLSGMRHRS